MGWFFFGTGDIDKDTPIRAREEWRAYALTALLTVLMGFVFHVCGM